METPDLRHWILFWSGLAAQIPFLWFLVRISFTGRYSSTSARLKARFACAVAGAAACCVFAALEQDQLLFWGQAAAMMCYIKLAQHQSRNEQKNKAVAKTFMIFAALAAVIYAVHAAGLDTMFDTAWVDTHIRGRGVWGYVLFLLVSGGLTAVGAPRQFVSFLAGYAFGALMGTVWGVLGTTLGCAFVFGWARVAGRGYVLKKHGRRIERLNNFIERNPFSMTLVIRCLPVGNNLLTNLAAGVSNIPAATFIGGSFIGYIPQTLIFALLGSGVRVDPVWRTTISGLLFAVSTLLGWMLYRRYRVEKTLDDPENGSE